MKVRVDNQSKTDKQATSKHIAVFFRRREYKINSRKLLQVLRTLGYKGTRLKKDTEELLKEYKLLDDYILKRIK